MQHQISNATQYDRYPHIFNQCVTYFKGKNPKILSFGCSDGREVETLRELYFPNSFIDGVDISNDMINQCKSKPFDEKINFYLADDFNEHSYDLIFCMSVLCRWPQTRSLSNCSEEYTFSQFENQLIQLDKRLNKNGLLVIYNSNFMFTDSKISSKYQVLSSNKIIESGFVKKFDKSHKEYLEIYPHCIFIKKHL